MAGDVAAFSVNAGVLVLIAGYAFPAEVIEDLLLDVLFEDGR